ncbi:hypothetical protein YQE_04362, partial [Dendroctonus ponderosae]
MERIFADRGFTYFMVILGALIRLCALSGNIYLIVIIARVNPPKRRIDVIILIYAIISCLYMILCSADLYWLTIEALFDLERFTEILINFTLTFLALSWYVPNYHSELYNKFPITFKYGVGVFFLLVSLGIAVLFLVFHDILLLYPQVYFIADLTCLTVCCLILLSLAILKRFKKPLPAAHKTEYAFSIPQVLLVMSATSTLIYTLLHLKVFVQYYRIYITLS